MIYEKLVWQIWPHCIKLFAGVFTGKNSGNSGKKKNPLQFA